MACRAGHGESGQGEYKRGKVSVGVTTVIIAEKSA